MQRLIHYYFKRPRGLEWQVEQQARKVTGFLCLLLGVVVSRYSDLTYWVIVSAIIVGVALYRQSNLLKELEKESHTDKESLP